MATRAMTTTFAVPEIHCEHCREAIEGALAPQQGVAGVEVDLGSKRVTVAHAEGTDIDRLTAAIEEQGYEVAKTESGP
ncbi:MAG: heavy-metal-associated domain-containing protein [Solirubrobacterales bacterium]